MRRLAWLVDVQTRSWFTNFKSLYFDTLLSKIFQLYSIQPERSFDSIRSTSQVCVCYRAWRIWAWGIRSRLWCWFWWECTVPKEHSGICITSKSNFAGIWCILLVNEEISLCSCYCLRAFYNIPAHGTTSWHRICSLISIDNICSSSCLWQNFAKIYCNTTSSCGSWLPIIEEFWARCCIINCEEDRYSSLSWADLMSSIEIIAENLHL